MWNRILETVFGRKENVTSNFSEKENVENDKPHMDELNLESDEMSFESDEISF